MKRFIAFFLIIVLITSSQMAFAFSEKDWENESDFNRIKALPDIVHPLYNQSKKQVMKRVYVDANSGNDSNDGSEKSPFKSIERAKEYVRTLNDNMTGNIEVILNDGIYRPQLTSRKEALYDPVPVEEADLGENQKYTYERKIRETRDVIQSKLQFTHEDSGSNGYSIVYKAAENANPVISGSVPVSGWELYDAQNNIYRAKANGIHTRNLIVNGNRALRAASSNEYNVDDFYSLFTNCVVDEIGLIVDEDYFLDWDNLKDTELVFLDPRWWGPRIKIDEAYKTEDGRTRIVMQQPAWFFVRHKGSLSTVNYGPHYMENNLKLLDAENEWYLDRHDDYFYYKPQNGTNINSLNIEAAVIEELILFEGDSAQESVSDIEFRNLTINNTTWLRPDTANGYADAQSNWIREGQALNANTQTGGVAGITLKYAKRILIEGCVLENIGSNAVFYERGTHDCLLIGNTIDNISGSGVIVGNVDKLVKTLKDPDDRAEMVVNNDVYSNRITNCATEYFSAVGLSVGTTRDVDVSYNEIGRCNYTGLHLSWGNYNDELVDKDVEKVTIQNNLIYDTNILLNDGAPIYARGPWYGSGDNPSIISGNYIAIDGYNAGVNGIYYDSGTYGWMAYNNYVQGYGGGITLNVSSDCNIAAYNNYLDVFRQIPVYQGREDLPYMLSMGLDHVNGYNGLPDAGKDIMKNAGLLPQYSDLSLFGEDDIFVIVPSLRRFIAKSGDEVQLKFYALNKHGEIIDNSSMKYRFAFYNDLTTLRYTYYKGVVQDDINTKAAPLTDNGYAVFIDEDNKISCLGNYNGYIWCEGEMNGKKYHTFVAVYSTGAQNVVDDALKYSVDGVVNVLPFFSASRTSWQHLNDFEIGGSIEYEINPPKEFGVYDVLLNAPASARSGIFSIYLNDKLVYDSLDFYERQGIQYLKIPKVVVNEETKDQKIKIKIECVGQNPKAEMRRMGIFGFEFNHSFDVGSSIILAPGSQYVSKDGIKYAINSNNKNACTKIINGTTFVPVEFVSKLDNAVYNCNNGVVNVSCADKEVTLETSQGDVYNEDGQVYVALRKMVQGLGYELNWYDVGLIILGDAGKGKSLKELYQLTGMVKGL